MISNGTKIAGGGAAIKLLCFFLPWVLVSCQEQPVASISAWQLATGGAIQTPFGAQPLTAAPDLLLILLAALGSLALVYLVVKQGFALRRAAMAWIGMASLSVVLMLLRFAGAGSSAAAQAGADVQIDLQFGYWTTLFACLMIITGGLIELIGVQATPAGALSSSDPAPAAEPDPPVQVTDSTRPAP
jgi:hypothetical protein